jgi:hypothetical protein
MRKITAGLLAAAAMGFAAPAMAQTNPWHPGQTTVPITVTVQEMVELFTDVTAVPLEIVDAGENQGAANAVSRVVNHLHNVDVDVSVEIDDDIPDNSQFHVIIEPTNAAWTTSNGVTGPAAEKVVSWRREGGVYSAASGGFDNQESATGVGDQVIAFSRLANAPSTLGDPDAVVDIQYFADARNVMPATGAETFNVIWTIAEQP